MSIDIKWETITSGEDGAALAEKIRAFVHQKFQQVTLPRFINAVHVHSFEFGSTCPEIEIKDICDPLPDFYEDEDESDGDDAHEPSAGLHSGEDFHGTDHHHPSAALTHRSQPRPRLADIATAANQLDLQHQLTSRDLLTANIDHLGGPFPRSTTPGIPGGTSNLSYFHFPGAALSGTQTPLAAVASGTPFSPRPWSHGLAQAPSMHQNSALHVPGHVSQGQRDVQVHGDPSTRPSTANSISSPRDSESGLSSPLQQANYPEGEHDDELALDGVAPLSPMRVQSRNPSDLQVVARVKYSGDVRMTLTAEILLDYPMPSFVGIPLKLAITGMAFDGVAIVAMIKRKMHFCFLDADDASALVGETVSPERHKTTHSRDDSKSHPSGPLREILVESEIGRQENGKQVLKNVGKVEKFVLEQVRKIFEEEFVFPSYWTFLV
ncbi:Mitochondrial distribution and morphology protein 12 [Rhinocladiella similis]